ncbi:RNA-directed DNA polymerase (reverse transcriptase) domain containing [Brachionus plicatilis]|uniref:RNA-directed DNA polymerase (Reverse transcriptase) domain containing n=1 Tax=Brachionus plicatilis TaxID=10195 RepID=A0A3M7SVN2_BRAPC|nr:RNA-directed DNA polymerase (reverse transcriptase) domain containing [Brachionus plicatilis]
MLKMRQIETEKVYKIQDLINYADCKMSSFYKQPFYNSTTSESDALQNRRYATKPNLKQTFGGNFKSNSFSYNNPREPNNQRQNKAFNPHQSTQKQVKFEDKGNSEPLHVINAVNLRKRPNRERPVIGVAIFNNTLVNYLCDSGADRTIINTKTFNLIKRHSPGTELEIHSGRELFSCSGPIKILDKVELSRCIVSNEEILKNVEILVTETVSNNDCLLLRDLINKLKHIGPRFEHIKTMVKKISYEVRRIFREEMREKHCKKTIKSCTYHNVKEEEIGSITNFDVEVHPENNFGKTEIVAELKETSLSKDDLNMEAVENARALLKNKIEEVSAKSVLDLKPDKNSDVAFEIEFQDPNQKPIKYRCRPIPSNLKEKVNTELDRQLKAGIIRPSRSQWCFPIRVVDKADGSIRITVDYKPLNKNRNCRMDKAKLDHDRKIKKFEYNIGDYVLTDHPKLKKGLLHGLAHYHGPFVVVGKNENNCDYLIKLASSPRSKVRQVHKNRLKYYFHSGHSLPTIKKEPVE